MLGTEKYGLGATWQSSSHFDWELKSTMANDSLQVSSSGISLDRMNNDFKVHGFKAPQFENIP